MLIPVWMEKNKGLVVQTGENRIIFFKYMLVNENF